MVKKFLLVPLLVVFLFAGVAHAQTGDLPNPGMLPGNPFYFLKSISESIGTFFTFGDIAKAERFLSLAQARLAEAKALADKGDTDRAEQATEKYQERLDEALQKADDAKNKGEDVQDVLTKVAEATTRHQEILAHIYAKVPEQAKDAIRRAMEKSMKGHDTALNAISGKQKTATSTSREATGPAVSPRAACEAGCRNQYGGSGSAGFDACIRACGAGGVLREECPSDRPACPSGESSVCRRGTWYCREDVKSMVSPETDKSGEHVNDGTGTNGANSSNGVSKPEDAGKQALPGRP